MAEPHAEPNAPDAKAPDPLDGFYRRLGYWFSRPVGKLVLTAILCLGLAGCVEWDEYVRATGRKSLPMAPNRGDFLLSLQLGALIGLVPFVADLLHSLGLAFTRMYRGDHKREQPQPKRSGVSLGALWTHGWSIVCFALFCALSVWCFLHEIFPPPAWFATLAVIFPGMLLLELIFGVDRPEEQPQAVQAEN